MMFDLIDSHCHLDAHEFDLDREPILEQCQQQGIRRLVIPGTRHSAWEKQLRLCQQHAGLYAALGLHPYFLNAHQNSDLDQLNTLLQSNHKIVAVGEIGLEFYIDSLDKQQQQYWFEAQLKLACDYQLPVILHVRKAHDLVLQTLRRYPHIGGIVHAFNGSLVQAQHYIQLGFKLGFGGVLTYPRAHKIRQLAQQLPLSSLVLETDAPDMVVQQHQGQRNSPLYLPHVLNSLAELRQQPPAFIAEQTSLNCQQLLKLAPSAYPASTNNTKL